MERGGGQGRKMPSKRPRQGSKMDGWRGHGQLDPAKPTDTFVSIEDGICFQVKLRTPCPNLK